MRKITTKIAPEINEKDNGIIKQTRHYKLITPLFGGGVNARENDESKLIRETSIRGQLRFWWRATRGTGSLAEMKQRENAIFGNGGKHSTQSKVSIVVNVTNKGKAEKLFQVNYKGKSEAKQEWEKIAYAAFPLDEVEQKEVCLNVEFNLEISYPKEIELADKDNKTTVIIDDVKAEIEAALWAWETFGGIGGRTRRGFGALELVSVNGDSKIEKYKAATAEQQIKEDLEKHLLLNKNCDASLPHLMLESVFRVKSASGATAAWENLIESLQSFRQYRLKEKDQYGNRIAPKQDKHGKSKWSEANAIRHLVLKDAKPDVLKFPRAKFGLPINFYFETPKTDKNDLSRVSNNEKPEVKLTAKDDKLDRLASPLILRPIQCGENKAIALAIILDTPQSLEGGVALKNLAKPIEVYSDLEVGHNINEAKKLTDNGLKPLNNNPNVLQAFLDYFSK